MPLEPTANPVKLSTDRISRRHLLGGALGLIASSTLLVGCSTGNSREAERGRERDAKRTSVVDNLQATKTANLVNSTPEPEATP